jgi:hypothetical protein
MWEKCQQLGVNRDHALVIQKALRPGPWFSTGPAFLAPLYRKRSLLLDRPNWVYAWTLYNDALITAEWLVPRSDNANLHLQIEIRSRQPTGWTFTIPIEIRRRGWLPSAGGIVMCESSDQELNFWRTDAYNSEATLEADC